MKKILSLLVLVGFVVCTTASAFAEMNYLNLGKDAIAPGRLDVGTEKLVVIQQPLFVETVGKSGKQYRGYLPVGTELVCVPTEKGLRAVRIYYCGNPILNPVYFPVSNFVSNPDNSFDSFDSFVGPNERAYRYGDNQPIKRGYDGNRIRQNLARVARGYSLGAGIKQEQYADAGYALERTLADEDLSIESIISNLIGLGIGLGTTNKPKREREERHYHYYPYSGSSGGLPDF